MYVFVYFTAYSLKIVRFGTSGLTVCQGSEACHGTPLASSAMIFDIGIHPSIPAPSFLPSRWSLPTASGTFLAMVGGKCESKKCEVRSVWTWYFGWSSPHVCWYSTTSEGVKFTAFGVLATRHASYPIISVPHGAEEKAMEEIQQAGFGIWAVGGGTEATGLVSRLGNWSFQVTAFSCHTSQPSPRLKRQARKPSGTERSPPQIQQ